MTKSTRIFAVIGAVSLMICLSAVVAPVHAERDVEQVTVELTYLGTDLKKREKEYSRRMNFAIHDIVIKDFEDMQDDAFKALKTAKKEWGDDHINTQMATATAQLAKANAILFFGGGTRTEALELVKQAQIFAALNQEFPGSYYINILADLSIGRLAQSHGENKLAVEYFDKALAAMKQSPGLSNVFWVQSERDYLLVP